MLCILFCRPFGACYVIAFTRGFTPGYILSALRACCRALQPLVRIQGVAFSFPSSRLGMRLCRKLRLRFFSLVSGIRLENGRCAESFALRLKGAGAKRSRRFSCSGVPKLELGNERM
mgnify:CR=1 FL=1